MNSPQTFAARELKRAESTFAELVDHLVSPDHRNAFRAAGESWVKAAVAGRMLADRETVVSNDSGVPCA